MNIKNGDVVVFEKYGHKYIQQYNTKLSGKNKVKFVFEMINNPKYCSIIKKYSVKFNRGDRIVYVGKNSHAKLKYAFENCVGTIIDIFYDEKLNDILYDIRFDTKPMRRHRQSYILSYDETVKKYNDYQKKEDKQKVHIISTPLGHDNVFRRFAFNLLDKEICQDIKHKFKVGDDVVCIPNFKPKDIKSNRLELYLENNIATISELKNIKNGIPYYNFTSDNQTYVNFPETVLYDLKDIYKELKSRQKQWKNKYKTVDEFFDIEDIYRIVEAESRYEIISVKLIEELIKKFGFFGQIKDETFDKFIQFIETKENSNDILQYLIDRNIIHYWN